METVEDKVENLVLRFTLGTSLPTSIKEELGSLIYSLVTEGNTEGLPDGESIKSENLILYISNIIYGEDGTILKVFDTEEEFINYSRDPHGGLYTLEGELKDLLVNIVDNNKEQLLCLHAKEHPPITTVVKDKVIILTWV